MKYLRQFNESKSEWDSYVTDLHNQYIKECEPYEEEITDEEINGVFNELQSQIDDSEDIEIYEVYYQYDNSTASRNPPVFHGLVKAMCPIEAIIKMSILSKNPDIFSTSCSAYTIEEEDIQSHINSIKNQLKKWETIY
jgi:aconitase A